MIPIEKTQYNLIWGDQGKGKMFILDCFYKADLKFPKHEDGYDRISVVLAGKLKEDISRKSHYAGSTSFVIKPGDVTHSNQIGPTGARLVSLLFHPDLVQQLDLKAFFTQLQWIHPSKVTPKVMQALMHIIQSEDWMSETIDLMASLSLKNVKHEHFPPNWLNRVKERIQDEIDLNLTVKDLAAMENLHPVYMARVFRKFEACGIKEYIHKEKMRRATQRLSDTKLPIVEIALDLGFADQSHMTRMFKNFVGVSPAAFRKFSNKPKL